MDGLDHHHTLTAGVLKEWDDKHIRPMNDRTATRLAEVAVREVVDALRYNPAWARSLGIGEA